VPDATDSRLLVIIDAMVLAAGLTSRKEPASFSRRLVSAVFDGKIELVLTETLLTETRAVLVDVDFRGHLPDVLTDVLLDALRVAATEIADDRGVVSPRRCDDPDDDYLVEKALASGAMLVSRDDAAGFASGPSTASPRREASPLNIGRSSDTAPGVAVPLGGALRASDPDGSPTRRSTPSALPARRPGDRRRSQAVVR